MQAAGALLPDPASCIPCSVSRGSCRLFFVAFVAFVVMKRVLAFGMVQRLGRMARVSMLVTACLSVAAPAPAELIDRILAIVDGRVIMLSDVRGFLRLGLITPARPEDPESETLTRLIERHLILAEVDRYVMEEPPPETIEQRLVEVQRRFATEAQFRDALAESGLSDEDLRQIVRDDTRIDVYLDRRFAAATQPTDAARRDELIADWVASLSDRSDVIRLDQPSAVRSPP